MIRILLLEDHVAFLEALGLWLELEPDMAVVAQARRLSEARTMLDGIDLAVIDLDLPDGNGMDLIRELRRRDRRVRVMVLTGSASRVDAARAVEAGADAILHKTVSMAEIVEGIRKLAAGEQIMDLSEIVSLLRLAAERREQDRCALQSLERLTPREREILQGVSRGWSDKEIAEQFHIGHETVRTHMVNIFGKIGVESRLQALLVAVRHGFVKLDE